MTYLTLPEFRATKTAVDDIAKAVGFQDDQDVRPGCLYGHGAGYIEHLVTGEHAGNYYLLIERADWISGELSALEAILWAQWYLPNVEEPPMLRADDGTLDDYIVATCDAYGATVDGDLWGVLFSGQEGWMEFDARQIMHEQLKGWSGSQALDTLQEGR